DQEDDIVESVDAEFRTGLTDIGFPSFRDIPAVISLVKMIEYEEKNHHVENQYREKMKAPEERNASHKSHQKRRIPNGGETSAHIGHHKYEKDHDMAFSSSPGIHLDHRTDHQH